MGHITLRELAVRSTMLPVQMYIFWVVLSQQTPQQQAVRFTVRELSIFVEL